MVGLAPVCCVCILFLYQHRQVLGNNSRKGSSEFQICLNFIEKKSKMEHFKANVMNLVPVIFEIRATFFMLNYHDPHFIAKIPFLNLNNIFCNYLNSQIPIELQLSLLLNPFRKFAKCYRMNILNVSVKICNYSLN